MSSAVSFARPTRFRSHHTRLECRRDDPLFLRIRPLPASLHRCDHLNLRLGHRGLVVGLLQDFTETSAPSRRPSPKGYLHPCLGAS